MGSFPLRGKDDPNEELNILTLERPRGRGGVQMDRPIGFSDLKFEAFKQSK